MCKTIALLCLAIALPAAAVTPEVELGVGLTGVANLDDSFTPSASLRAGVDFGYFTASVRGSGVLGAAGHEYLPDSSYDDPSGFQAWQALAEIRAHTSGTVQFHLALAGGVGKVMTVQCYCYEHFAAHGRLAFTWQLSAGARWLLSDNFSLGAELARPTWNKLFAQGGGGQRQQPLADGTLNQWALSLSAGWRFHAL